MAFTFRSSQPQMVWHFQHSCEFWPKADYLEVTQDFPPLCLCVHCKKIAAHLFDEYPEIIEFYPKGLVTIVQGESGIPE